MAAYPGEHTPHFRFLIFPSHDPARKILPSSRAVWRGVALLRGGFVHLQRSAAPQDRSGGPEKRGSHPVGQVERSSSPGFQPANHPQPAGTRGPRTIVAGRENPRLDHSGKPQDDPLCRARRVDRTRTVADQSQGQRTPTESHGRGGEREAASSVRPIRIEGCDGNRDEIPRHRIGEGPPRQALRPHPTGKICGVENQSSRQGKRRGGEEVV